MGGRSWTRKSARMHDPCLLPPHGIGFALAGALPYRLFGLLGARVLLLLLSGLTGLLIAALCDRWGLPLIAGTAAGLMLMVAPTWQLHASRFQPECLAGLISVAVLWLLDGFQTVTWRRALLTGVLVGYLPFLY